MGREELAGRTVHVFFRESFTYGGNSIVHVSGKFRSVHAVPRISRQWCPERTAVFQLGSSSAPLLIVMFYLQSVVLFDFIL